MFISKGMNEIFIIFACLLFVVCCYLFVRNVETYIDPLTKKIHEDLLKIDPRAAMISISGSDQSFTEDKTRMYLCLRDEKGEYYDYNMLMYVAIHELAHVISKQVDPDHKTDEFRDNFDFLKKRAASKGLWDPKKPLNYQYCPKDNEDIKKYNGGIQGGKIIEPGDKKVQEEKSN